MLIAQFCNKYNIDESTIYVAKGTGRIQSSAFGRDGNNLLTIDEKFFIRRYEFKRRTQLFLHDMYYFLSEHFSNSHLARKMSERYGGSVAGYSTYFSSDLFRNIDKSIISYRIEAMDYKFFKYARLILMAVKRRSKGLSYHLAKRGVKLDIGYLLDLRTEKYLEGVA